MTILFSDRGTPRSYRHMNGYSSHTFMWYNAKGEYCLGQVPLQDRAGHPEPRPARRPTGCAATIPTTPRATSTTPSPSGEFPAWRVDVQIMTPEEAKNYRFDPFDITKVWPHADFPPIEIGRMVLNRNPENYFAEVEQAAFSPGNFVPGIGPSPDKMLQGRLFSYHDTHLHRLGPNYHLLPVNAPRRRPMANYQRDGSMRFDDNGGGGPELLAEQLRRPGARTPASGIPPIDLAGQAARHAYTLGDDDFVQAGDLYRKVMTDTDREHLVGNIVGPPRRARRSASSCGRRPSSSRPTADYGERVAKGLGLDVSGGQAAGRRCRRRNGSRRRLSYLSKAAE